MSLAWARLAGVSMHSKQNNAAKECSSNAVFGNADLNFGHSAHCHDHVMLIIKPARSDMQ